MTNTMTDTKFKFHGEGQVWKRKVYIPPAPQAGLGVTKPAASLLLTWPRDPHQCLRL